MFSRRASAPTRRGSPTSSGRSTRDPAVRARASRHVAVRDHDHHAGSRTSSPVQPGSLRLRSDSRRPHGRQPADREPGEPPVTNPPMWPSFEMPWTENVRTKLSAMMPTSHCRSRPSRRTRTRQAPNSPKIAPDAPTTGLLRAAERVDRGADPPSAREQVHRDEAPPAEHRSSGRPDDRERQHVRRDVQQADVQERRGHQPVVAVLAGARAYGSSCQSWNSRVYSGLVQPRAATLQRGARRRRATLSTISDDRRRTAATRAAARRPRFGGARTSWRPAAASSGQWKPTEAARMHSGQIGRSQRVQRISASRWGCR